MKQAAICIIHDMYNSDYVHMLMRSPDDKIAPGKLCFPGGKLEPGESFRDACIREVYEETGFVLSNDHLKTVDTIMIGDCETMVFRCWKYESKDRFPVLSSEHTDYNLISWDTNHNPDWFGIYTLQILIAYRNRLTTDKVYRDAVYPGVKDIKIGEMIIPPKTPRESFEVVCNWFSGDADVTHRTTKVVPLSDKDRIIAELNQIELICSSDTIHECISEWPIEDRKLYNNGLVEWPADCYSDGDTAAEIDTIEVYYYNDRGEKHSCEIIDR